MLTYSLGGSFCSVFIPVVEDKTPDFPASVL